MRGLVHRIGRLLVIGGGVALGALHIAILFRRVVEGTLLKPLVMAQWLVALALVTAAGYLRRRGISVFRGRKAAAFWIVVALMHGIASLPGGPGVVGVFETVPGTDALPLAVGLLVGALVVFVGLLTPRSRPDLACLGMRRAATRLFAGSRWPLALGARAPPA
ncbi:MAG: hypothetical protein IH936_06390 [Acidobacteria bacterium]|nr:hypothetical protein [Acidobacteriota bacterium]